MFRYASWLGHERIRQSRPTWDGGAEAPPIGPDNAMVPPLPTRVHRGSAAFGDRGPVSGRGRGGGGISWVRTTPRRQTSVPLLRCGFIPEPRTHSIYSRSRSLATSRSPTRSTQARRWSGTGGTGTASIRKSSAPGRRSRKLTRSSSLG
jgi:hypothetical protein